MASFLCLWQVPEIRTRLEHNLDKSSLCALRLASSACCNLATPALFVRTRLTFSSTALTKPSRIEALGRIGQHIEHLTFSMPHSASTFLPPLLNPLTGREVVFLYTPHTTVASQLERPKYGSPELGDILTQQYPPLFHAATNVPAFIQAMRLMPNLRHLSISCPSQDPTLRYRRDIVDYALTSLRIAVEQTPLPRLEKLSLHPIHASGLHYLRYMPGFGASPVGARRWRQIRKLNISIEAWDFYGPNPCLDHLKIIDDFIRGFSGNLEKLRFSWIGQRGPCPFSLSMDPLFAPPRKRSKLFGEVTSPNSPLPAAPTRTPIVFSKLRHVQLRNATMVTSQVSSFIQDHRDSVKEFDFENVMLGDGVWEEALGSLTRSNSWRSSSDESVGEEPVLKLKKRRRVKREGPHRPLQPKVGDALTISDRLNERTTDVPDRLKEMQKSSSETLRERPNGTSSGKSSRERLREQPDLSRQKSRNVLSRKNSRNASGDDLTRPVSPPLNVSLPILQPTRFNPDASIQGVQRNLQHDEEMLNLTYDSEHRETALQKAKQAVLSKLSNQFRASDKKHGRKLALKIPNESRTELVPLMLFS